jgi:hypothetical protein
MAAVLVVSLYIFVSIKGISIKNFIFSLLCVLLTLGIFFSSDTVQNRLNEIVERNESANFQNDNYVRVLLVNYYYSEYFKNNYEMIMGSGMVRRVYDNSEVTKTFKGKYPSEYSKQVSFYSDRYHYFPVDMGLIGLSWEAGIPAVVVLYLLCFLLLIPAQKDNYTYIRGWGLFLILTSITVPFYYYHKNMIYTVIVLVIFMKLKEIEIVHRK